MKSCNAGIYSKTFILPINLSDRDVLVRVSVLLVFFGILPRQSCPPLLIDTVSPPSLDNAKHVGMLRSSLL